MKTTIQYQGNEFHLEELKGFVRGMGLNPEIKEYEEKSIKYTSMITNKILVKYNKSDNLFNMLLIEEPSKIKELEKKN